MSDIVYEKKVRFSKLTLTFPAWLPFLHIYPKHDTSSQIRTCYCRAGPELRLLTDYRGGGEKHSALTTRCRPLTLIYTGSCFTVSKTDQVSVEKSRHWETPLQTCDTDTDKQQTRHDDTAAAALTVWRVDGVTPFLGLDQFKSMRRLRVRNLIKSKMKRLSVRMPATGTVFVAGSVPVPVFAPLLRTSHPSLQVIGILRARYAHNTHDVTWRIGLNGPWWCIRWPNLGPRFPPCDPPKKYVLIIFFSYTIIYYYFNFKNRWFELPPGIVTRWNQTLNLFYDRHGSYHCNIIVLISYLIFFFF